MRTLAEEIRRTWGTSPSAIIEGRVWVNNQLVRDVNYRVHPGDQIAVRYPTSLAYWTVDV